MKLAIAFLLYKDSSYKYLEKFVLSLKRATKFLENSEAVIIIGDNSGSDDRNKNFFSKINKINSIDIDYLDFGVNLGFAKAYNLIIKKANSLDCQYFLMLNPDLQVNENAIINLLDYVKKNKTSKVIAPKILVWDFYQNLVLDKIDSCGIALKPGLIFKDIGQGKSLSEKIDISRIIGPSGAVAFFKLSVLEEIKENNQYFDEKFFMYKEDCDLAFRLYLNNIKVDFLDKSLFYHDRSVSDSSLFNKLKGRKKRSKQERIWSFHGQHYIFIKHFSKLNIFNKLMLMINIVKLFLLALIFEQFLLKEYLKIFNLKVKK